MTDILKILEVKLEKPELVTDVELNFLLSVKYYQNRFEFWTNVFKSRKIVDIQIFLMKSGSLGKSKITTSR